MARDDLIALAALQDALSTEEAQLEDVLQRIGVAPQLPEIEPQPTLSEGQRKFAGLLEALDIFVRGRAATPGRFQPLTPLEEDKAAVEANRLARQRRAEQQALLDAQARQRAAGAELDIVLSDREQAMRLRELEQRQQFRSTEREAAEAAQLKQAETLRDIDFKNEQRLNEQSQAFQRELLQLRKDLEGMGDEDRSIRRSLRAAAVDLRRRVESGELSKEEAARLMEDSIIEVAPTDAVAAETRALFLDQMQSIPDVTREVGPDSPAGVALDLFSNPRVIDAVVNELLRRMRGSGSSKPKSRDERMEELRRLGALGPQGEGR